MVNDCAGWVPVPVKGIAPAARAQHCAVLVGDSAAPWARRSCQSWLDCFHNWLVVTGTWLDYFSIDWEVHHPNWRTHIFQRGRRKTTNQRETSRESNGIYHWHPGLHRKLFAVVRSAQQYDLPAYRQPGSWFGTWILFFQKQLGIA